MDKLGLEQVREKLGWNDLIEAIYEVARKGCEQPLRTAHTVKVPGEPDATFLMMPAWQSGGKLAVKLAFIAPGNAERDLPAVNASVVTFDARTGEPLSIIEGGELTARRTAATSALAARYMVRNDAEHLLIVGAGRIAANLIEAHSTIRQYSKITVWARDPAKARAFAAASALEVSVASDLDGVIPTADTVSAATISSEPLIKGELLKPGTHVDLVGGFLPTMREADDECVRRARGAIVVDTKEGVLAEAGDITQPLENGVITEADILGDLAMLCRGEVSMRQNSGQISMFKSVGAAFQDFAAAAMI